MQAGDSARSLAAARLVVLALSLSVCEAIAQTPPLSLTLASDLSRSIPVRSIRQQRLVLASVADIAEALALPTRENTEYYSLEIRHRNSTVTFVADDTFVVVAEARKEKTAQQLASPVLASVGVLYAPVASLALSFEKLFGAPATYDAASNRIRVGKPKPPFDVSSFSLEQKNNGTILRIPSERKFSDIELLRKDDGWVYLTIPGARSDAAALKKVKLSNPVKKFVINQFATALQLAFLLDAGILSAELVKDADAGDIAILLRSERELPRADAEEKPRRDSAANENRRKRYELDVIVLDAGHGGKDPGTIGVRGTYEKNVVLPIVRKLGKLITRYMKNVKVVYTRDDDRFIELDRRGQIANEANGKLFVSVHANAMPRKPHPRRGFEVYLLRPGRTDEAIAIAERENSVIEFEEGYEQRYQKLTDENFILVTMAQAAHMKSSERFADLVAREMGKTLDTENNGVLQAGFFVLVGASMPNVLIETGYLTNRDDERLLRSDEGQQQYAEAIFSALKKYKAEYERLLQEGDDLGTNARLQE
jgi:N-acetylmuramoyl-L-alanine amidase